MVENKMKVVFISPGFENNGIEYLSSALKEKKHQVTLVIDPCLFDDQYVFIPLLAKIFSSKNEVLAFLQKLKN